VITPRATRLVRADSLPALHRVLLSLATRGDLDAIRRRAIIVPSRAAAQQLRQTLEILWFDLHPAGSDAALVLPDLLTRADWYRQLYERAGFTEPMLSSRECEVLLGASARDAVASGVRPPFHLRPGLVGEMLALYDALRAQQRGIDTFERIVIGDLEPRAETDRGAERLLRQTRFLVAAFRAFEHRVAASGRLDEQTLRQRLLEGDHPASAPTAWYSHLVIAAGDRTADPVGGLYPADVDLAMRLPHVETIHLVATRGQVSAGLGERLHDLIPELEETDAGQAEPGPRLLAPAGADERLHFVSRDREEELRAIARWIKHEARGTEPADALDRVAVVFKRPLPYVYLARTVFDAAGVEYQASDALPLASEPMAAVFDLVVACVESRFARSALTALLRCPHLSFADIPSRGVSGASDDIDAFDRRLAESGYLGHPDTLASVADGWQGPGAAAARAAATVAASIRPILARQTVSAHAASLLSFLRGHERLDAADETIRSRHLRARAAVLRAIEELRRASLDFDDPECDIADVASTVRRWIESRTFSPRLGAGGVQLVDAQAARYGTFESACFAGLAEGDWPGPSGRNIFYPAFLLSQLGWPSESARLAAARADFVDLLRLPHDRARVSTFTLEDDSIVNPSPLIEELPRAGLFVEKVDGPDTLVFEDEALGAATPAAGAVGGDARAWLDLRLGRGPASEQRFHGAAGPGRRRVHTVTGIDQFLQCPFKYFAGKVLDLPEEATDEPSRSPRARGQFVHEVLHEFFASWQSAGGATIAVDTLDAARAHFAEVAGRKLATLPAADAGLERLRLLGSVATPGLGEIVLAAEASRAAPVRERLLEYALEGEFLIQGAGGSRHVRLRGKADRVDLLADGRFRVIDYKNGKSPDLAQTIQLPIYAVCVQQQLQRTRQERWEVAEAGYLAFGDEKPDRVVVADGHEAARTLSDGQERLLDAVDRIERGEFPPRPAAARLCGTCPYATVCRKDFVDAD
jgi:RecB family exonuclease